MVSPIKAGEVWQALKESTDSAPGLDGVRLEKLKSCPTTILVTYTTLGYCQVMYLPFSQKVLLS